MNSKLTLSFDKSIIDKAKRYAKGNKTSLSKLIESYLNSIIKQKKQNIEITTLVDSLSGVISLKKGHESKKDYINYLNEKYK